LLLPCCRCCCWHMFFLHLCQHTMLLKLSIHYEVHVSSEVLMPCTALLVMLCTTCSTQTHTSCWRHHSPPNPSCAASVAAP
jgi:hypothetical protein